MCEWNYSESLVDIGIIMKVGTVCLKYRPFNLISCRKSIWMTLCWVYTCNSMYQILEQSNQINFTALGWYQFTFVLQYWKSDARYNFQNKIHALNLQNRFYLDYYSFSSAQDISIYLEILLAVNSAFSLCSHKK